MWYHNQGTNLVLVPQSRYQPVEVPQRSLMLTLYNHNHLAPPTQQCLAIANPSAF